MFKFKWILILALIPLVGFAKNYTDPEGPIYSKNTNRKNLHSSTKIKTVSFNLAFCKNIPGIVKMLREYEDADVIFLQEVTGIPGDEQAHAAKQIASLLNLNYAYSPSMIHHKNDLDFGVAILSKHELRDIKKLILPHLHPTQKTMRIALAATIDSGYGPVRIYSTHLETILTSRQRKNQARVILKDADQFDRVLIGGDFNSFMWQRWKLTRMFRRWGYKHVTRGLGHTIRAVKGIYRSQVDLIFSKGLKTERKGKKYISTVSDHFLIWSQQELI